MRERPQGDFLAMRRRVRVEAGAWGLLTALTNAFAGPLLVARGADAAALAVYTAGTSLFGLGAAGLGPRLARRTGGAARPALAALAAGRLAFVVAAILVVAAPSGAVPALIAALVLWSAGEGIALPLWTTFLAGLVAPPERGRWVAWRATVAAGAVAVALPPLVLLAVASAERAWPVAFAVAAAAGLVSAAQWRALFAAAPAPAPREPAARRWARTKAEDKFLAGVFGFWFGAAFNRPLLPPFLVQDLGATPAYFAASAVVAALAGLLAQRWWGAVAEAKGGATLLAWSGLAAGAVPLLWAAIPVVWIGLVVEAIAAGGWLGHLLGLTLRAAELARDDAERPDVVARVHLAQGSAAAAAPLVAAAVVGSLGTRPALVASGLACLAATGLVVDLRAPAWLARFGEVDRRWSARRGE